MEAEAVMVAVMGLVEVEMAVRAAAGEAVRAEEARVEAAK